MNETPKGNKLHIGIFGKRNVGKSTLINTLTGQELSIVSPVAGTTTDTVWKSMELHPIGPVVFVDTPGIDDEGALGLQRVERTKKALAEIDAVIWVVKEALEDKEKEYIAAIREKQKPIILVFNIHNQASSMLKEVNDLNEKALVVNAKTGQNIEKLKDVLIKLLGQQKEVLCVGDRLQEGQVVLVIAPQDLQAPKGRLILPQVQVLREIIDAKAIPIMTTTETIESTLSKLKELPEVVITDSQLFGKIEKYFPSTVQLTSFSIAMARQKGDLQIFVEGAKEVENLKEKDKILIIESCTHTPLHGDIARDKIPKALLKRVGKSLQFDFIRGSDFPKEIADYQLVIHCGGCMQTPMQLKNKIEKCIEQQVPITNFGIILAYLNGTLERTVKIYNL